MTATASERASSRANGGEGGPHSPQTYPLTKRQRELLSFIAGFEAEKGRSPSVREMEAGAAIKGRASLYMRLAALEERGHITRLGGARQIEILKPATIACALDGKPFMARFLTPQQARHESRSKEAVRDIGPNEHESLASKVVRLRA